MYIYKYIHYLGGYIQKVSSGYILKDIDDIP